jgi:hypothetical protein
MRRRGAAVGRRAGDAVRSEREKTAGAAIERRRPRRAHLWMRANPAMNIGGVGTSGTRSPRARVRSSVRAECRVPRHRLAASVRARAVDDVHARSRVPEADCEDVTKNREVPPGIAKSLTRCRAVARGDRDLAKPSPSGRSLERLRRSLCHSERRAAGVDARARGLRATASAAMKVRSRPAPARRAAPDARVPSRPVVQWTPPPNIAGSRVSFPPDAIAP